MSVCKVCEEEGQPRVLQLVGLASNSTNDVSSIQLQCGSQTLCMYKGRHYITKLKIASLALQDRQTNKTPGWPVFQLGGSASIIVQSRNLLLWIKNERFFTSELGPNEKDPPPAL